MKRTLLSIIVTFLLAACVNPMAVAPTVTRTPDKCPEVGTLDPAAFRKFTAGSCVTLIPPVMPKEPFIWCPVNSELPRTGNELSLIGEIKTLLRRQGDEFSVVTPDPVKGVVFVPLEHEGGYVWLEGVKLFHELGNQRYTCLIETLVSIP